MHACFVAFDGALWPVGIAGWGGIGMGGGGVPGEVGEGVVGEEGAWEDGAERRGRGGGEGWVVVG